MPSLSCISILEAGLFSADSGNVLIPSGEQPFPVQDFRALSGTSALAFTVSGFLSQIGSANLAGTIAVTFTTSGNLMLSGGAFIGTSSVTFTTSGDLTLTGAMALSGTSSLTFTPVGNLQIVTFATLDGTATNATLTNGNLTATHTGTSGDSGARSTATKNSGKIYFEVACTTINTNGDAVAVLTAAGTYTNLVTNGSNCAAVYKLNGAIWSNNANSGRTLGTLANGDIIGVACDLDNEKVWFRKAPSGNWNGQVIGSQNPETNTGGVSISSFSATTMAPALGFGAGTTGSSMTCNFGVTAFSGTVPSGFNAGWMA